ncbi:MULTISPECIES: helix-turn-helix transcriptional regulator [unclassified Sulfitobacter]|uniref:helix-turn-helix transcriptional regulator n=2 Tax=Sulfitobacter TaxID=60136 RepID=UPI0037457EEB
MCRYEWHHSFEKEITMTDKILRCRDVQEVTGLSRSTIYRMMDRDDFPKATKLGVRAIGWRQSAVADWIQERSQ